MYAEVSLKRLTFITPVGLLQSMSHCVPDWDGNDGELNAIIPTIEEDQDVSELHWIENGQVIMQGQGSKGNKPQWQVNYANNWSGGQESEDAVTPSMPPNSSQGKESPIANEPVGTPVITSAVQDDEMVSWLQYPLDDTLERNYCSEFFGELPNSNISNMQLLKDSFLAGQGMTSRSGRNLGVVNSGYNGALSRSSSADAAMAIGAGRAAGLLPQAGVEAFTKVRTKMQQPYTGKWSSPLNADMAKTAGAVPTSISSTRTILPNLSPTMLPPKGQGMSVQPAATGPMNFSHFSLPAVLMKANLQCLGMSHGGLGTSRKNQCSDASTASGSSIVESTTARDSDTVLREDTELHIQRSEGRQQRLGTESSWPSMENSLSAKDAEAAVDSAVDHMDSESTPVEQDNLENVDGTSCTVAGMHKLLSGAGLHEAPEPTITSSSGASGNSTDKGKEAASSGKRRMREGEESEYQSEDGEDEMVELKKPHQRGTTTKRSRAAEVHNLSERRRRDRINEKMKALQELIPNSNKTDKASMLDEAIEYLKMLQLQLQMMSMRSGMSIPSMVMPAGMQHLQIAQMGPMPPMGMGMGMGPVVGMGMGMMDLGFRHGQVSPHLIPVPSPGGPSYSVSASAPAATLVDSHDHRLQSASVMESLNYLARQHQQLQLSPQPMDMYNAYMMHQHQQHQQQQQHQQHQQHQHHLHHQPNNRAGGAP